MKKNNLKRQFRKKKFFILRMISGFKCKKKKESTMFDLFQETQDSWPPYLTDRPWKIGPIIQ